MFLEEHCTLADRDIKGANLGDTAAADPEECRAVCENLEGCAAATFIPDLLQCFPKTSADTEKFTRQGYVTVRPHCGIALI